MIDNKDEKDEATPVADKLLYDYHKLELTRQKMSCGQLLFDSILKLTTGKDLQAQLDALTDGHGVGLPLAAYEEFLSKKLVDTGIQVSAVTADSKQAAANQLNKLTPGTVVIPMLYLKSGAVHYPTAVIGENKEIYWDQNDKLGKRINPRNTRRGIQQGAAQAANSEAVSIDSRWARDFYENEREGVIAVANKDDLLNLLDRNNAILDVGLDKESTLAYTLSFLPYGKLLQFLGIAPQQFGFIVLEKPSTH